MTGPVFHLWHERPDETMMGAPGYAANDALRRRYMDARTSRPDVEAILREPGGPLAHRPLEGVASPA